MRVWAALALGVLLAGCGGPEEEPLLLRPKEGKWIVLLETWRLTRDGEELGEDRDKAEIDAHVGKKRSHCFTLHDLTLSEPAEHAKELKRLEEGEEEPDEASFGTPGFADFRFQWHLGNQPDQWVVNARGLRPGSTFGLAAEQEGLDAESGVPLARYLELQPYVITYLNAPWGIPNNDGFSVMRVVPSGWSLTRSGEEMSGFHEWSYYTRGCPTRRPPPGLAASTCANKDRARKIVGVVDLIACKNLCATIEGCVSGVYVPGGARCYLYGALKDPERPDAELQYEPACRSILGPRTHTVFDCGEGPCKDDDGCGVAQDDEVPPGASRPAACDAGNPDDDPDEQQGQIQDNQERCCACGGGVRKNEALGAGSKLLVGHDHALALWLGEGRWFENEECPVDMFDKPPWGKQAVWTEPASTLQLGAERVGQLAHDLYEKVASLAEARPSAQ